MQESIELKHTRHVRCPFRETYVTDIASVKVPFTAFNIGVKRPFRPTLDADACLSRVERRPLVRLTWSN